MKTFYAQNGETKTELFETFEEALDAACERQMAPFQIVELRPYLVALRHTNARAPKPAIHAGPVGGTETT